MAVQKEKRGSMSGEPERNSEERDAVILAECRDWAVCVKPAGPDSEKEFPEQVRRVLGGEVLPVHRLDRNVGGLILYARNRASAAELSRILQQGLLEKEYVAVCHGRPPEAEGRMEDLLWKDPAKNKVFVVDRPRGGVRKASLRYRMLKETAPGETLVGIRLETGRSHQIRVQFASRGCPLKGDHKYGARDREKNPALFCCGLSFPWQGEEKTFRLLPAWAE